MSQSLHTQVVESLGRKIVRGELSRGAVVRAEVLESEYGVSRGVIREALRSLALLGLTESVKSVGVRVRDRIHWNPYAREIIRWRLAENDLGAQLRALTELRSAVEPVAAALAAQHAPDELSGRLMEIAARMRTVGRSGDLHTFEALDIEFHALVLVGSGNEMFAHLDIPIAEVLKGRTELGLMPERPHEEALQWHVDVADAIQGRRPREAREAMDKIVERTIAEIEQIWSDVPRIYPPADA
ncbi:FadR/GntR family transcriptional regulator [Jonesia quinghaiensis]|uniref:FadR/GntR family transcriptional regulator n=1 Tax=Jonesia quinghaiensis TaxID=262806 RepID=UPI0004178C71|nr:FCD domain-containing protein [Jonesia quinghaiensis]